ncbi:MAG: phosphoenolpyruvate--protein phosphotransferase [Lachnospiraceae bacterium]|nr:phosphoenolpyruvate--protein phosphotransferase [Lachnospiraceae bacterium]
MKEKSRKLNGIGIYDDIGIGPAFVIREYKPDYKKKSLLTPDQEKLRFKKAMDSLCQELEIMIADTRENVGEDETDIMEAQLILTRDSSISEQTLLRIDKGYTSEGAIVEVCTKCMDSFRKSGDRMLIDRAEDIGDIMHRLLLILADRQTESAVEIPEGSVVVCEELNFYVARALFVNKPAGIVTRRGGSSGHAALIVRGLMIPAVFSVNSITKVLSDGQEIIVNGQEGLVYINPEEEDRDECIKKQAAIREWRALLSRYKDLPGLTSDGVPFAVLCNIGSVEEIGPAVSNGCEGVGLFRTEFMFQQKGVEPTEDEQADVYRRVAINMKEMDTVIRTLDVGGDKMLPYQFSSSRSKEGQEKNPFLGLRGIRNSLVYRETFIRQIKAILRAAVYGNVSISLPMVTNLSEIREAKKIISLAAAQLEREGAEFVKNVPVGVMIETPAAAFMADDFAREADFFSVGTNDLTQYIMCAERGNPQVEYLSSIFEPSVIRAIYRIIESAKKAHIRVGMCGEASKDKRYLALLAAWGANGVSVGTSQITAVRAMVAELGSEGKKELFEPVLSMATREEIIDFLDRNV